MANGRGEWTVVLLSSARCTEVTSAANGKWTVGMDWGMDWGNERECNLRSQNKISPAGAVQAPSVV